MPLLDQLLFVCLVRLMTMLQISFVVRQEQRHGTIGPCDMARRWGAFAASGPAWAFSTSSCPGAFAQAFTLFGSSPLRVLSRSLSLAASAWTLDLCLLLSPESCYNHNHQGGGCNIFKMPVFLRAGQILPLLHKDSLLVLACVIACFSLTHTCCVTMWWTVHWSHWSNQWKRSHPT